MGFDAFRGVSPRSVNDLTWCDSWRGVKEVANPSSAGATRDRKPGPRQAGTQTPSTTTWGHLEPKKRGQFRPSTPLKQRRQFSTGTVLIVDGTLVPTRDHAVAQQSKNYRYSTNHQVVIDADSRLVVVVGRPLPGNRNDCKAWAESGARAAVGKTTTIADGGYPGTGLVIPHCRPADGELCDWKHEHNRSRKQVRARVEHVFARMKTWKILRDCRLRGDGVHHAILSWTIAESARPSVSALVIAVLPPEPCAEDERGSGTGGMGEANAEMTEQIRVAALGGIGRFAQFLMAGGLCGLIRAVQEADDRLLCVAERACATGAGSCDPVDAAGAEQARDPSDADGRRDGGPVGPRRRPPPPSPRDGG